jgi:glyceraldehyde-3-phosphate dehydrogenase/erythrose-4-phosphate dehydrogenase
MATRVGINGFGRVGRAFTRHVAQRGDIEVVAINDLADVRTLAHLLRFDSTYGRFGRPVEVRENSILIGGSPVAVLSERDPADIDWARLGADVVIESTGKFRGREQAAAHLKGGVRKVIISAPGKQVDLTVVMGVNDREYDPEVHDVISNASCTTNRAAAQGGLAGILRYCTDPVVSRDIIGDPASCVLDSELTQASGTLVKVFGWYDNEWGYSCRLADLAALVGSRL